MKLGILISGGGTTMVNLHERITAGKLKAEIVCVISSSSKAAGLEKAKGFGYPTHFLGRRKFADDVAYSEALTALLQEHGAELVILAGFLKMYLPSGPYKERTLNIHPSLIPSFCGKGFYGMKVHEAVWKRGCRVSGCTVHLVNENYDEGPIIVQRTVPLTPEDDPERIRQKVWELECEAYPHAIKLFVNNRISFENGRAVID